MDPSGEQQSGAAGVCWAHNPEVDGSKPSSAKCRVIDYKDTVWMLDCGSDKTTHLQTACWPTWSTKMTEISINK